MNINDLDQRRNDILQAIIEAYVSEASPVGSELVSRKLRQSLSPATIRNVMAELEEEGLVEQPHTSAGRVPTDRGYRYYVDTLMDAIRLSQEDLKRLAEAIQPHESEIERLLERVSTVLSELSHHPAFVIAPTVKQSTITHIELMPLGVRKFLCVLVGQESFIASHMIEVDEPMTRDEALSLVHFLNTEMAGLPARELLASLERRLLAVNDSFYHVVKRSLNILQMMLAFEPDERLLVEGAAHLFEQPEFQEQPQKIHELLRQLELEHALLAQLRADVSREGTRVRIGREVGIEGFEECSYIVSPFSLHHAVWGGVGILGPRRMDYRRMRALVEGVAGLVTHALAQWELDNGAGRE